MTWYLSSRLVRDTIRVQWSERQAEQQQRACTGCGRLFVLLELRRLATGWYCAACMPKA